MTPGEGVTMEPIITGETYHLDFKVAAAMLLKTAGFMAEQTLADLRERADNGWPENFDNTRHDSGMKWGAA